MSLALYSDSVGSVVVLMPPYCTTEKQARQMVGTFREAIAETPYDAFPSVFTDDTAKPPNPNHQYPRNLQDQGEPGVEAHDMGLMAAPREKRWRPTALQDAAAFSNAPMPREASWSAPALWRFVIGISPIQTANLAPTPSPGLRAVCFTPDCHLSDFQPGGHRHFRAEGLPCDSLGWSESFERRPR
jgi:hypothetical protein